MVKENSKLKKMTRRESIGYMAKIAAWAGIGGVVGNLGGKGYKLAKETADYMKKPVEETEKFIEKAGNKYNSFKEKTKKFLQGDEYHVPEKKEIPLEPEKISRRGLFKKLFTNYPVETSTAVGGGIGASIGGVKGHDTYVRKKSTREIKEGQQRIEEKLDKLLNKEEGLEKTIEGNNEENTFLTIGLAGWLLSIIFASFKLTGNVISISNFSPGFYFIPVIFLASLVFIYIGLKKKTNF